MAPFIKHQILAIKKGGLFVLFRKILILLSMFFALFIVIIVRILRPIILIRFGPLHSSRIGHFSGDIELYLCERDLVMQDMRSLDIFYHIPPICNQQLKKMWKRRLRIFNFAGRIDWLNRRLPGGDKHVIRPFRTRDIHGLFTQAQAHLSFTQEEEELGRQYLRELGIPDTSPFVCLHCRDSSYLNTTYPDRDWRYHNYLDCNIRNFIPAAEELTKRGYFVVRMGAVVKEGLNLNNPMIIDYAKNGRNDFLDIYLCSRCRFFLGSTSGLVSVPMVFRRPTIWSNFIPLEVAPSWGKNDLIIPKKLWIKKEKRLLTFREILDAGIGAFYHTEKYEELGIGIIENSADEILEVAIEMDERLNERWRVSEEDEELQRLFWSLLRPNKKMHGKISSRVGALFLRQNRNLLRMI